MPEVSGLLETSLYVDDLERAIRFYEGLFGFERLVADQRICALSVAGKQVLLLFQRGASAKALPQPEGLLPPHDATGQLHLAFAIPAAQLDAWEKRLREKGIAIESRMHWERGGQSLYFRDPDQNLVELATPGVWAMY